MKKTEVKRYYLCEATMVTIPFSSLDEMENFENIGIIKINNDKNSNYFLALPDEENEENEENEEKNKAKDKDKNKVKSKGKDGYELKLIKYRILEQDENKKKPGTVREKEKATLKFLDKRTFETYRVNPSFDNSNPKRKIVIVYIFNGARRLSLATKDSIDYLDKKFLINKIFSLIINRKMKVVDITTLECIKKNPEFNDTADGMATAFEKYDENWDVSLGDLINAVINKIAITNYTEIPAELKDLIENHQEATHKPEPSLTTLYTSIKNFIELLHTDKKGNEQYRRFRDIAFFVYRREKKLKEQEQKNPEPEVEPEVVKPIVIEPIDKIGDFVLPKPMQTSFLGEDRAMVLYTKAGTQAKKQDS